MAVVHVLDDYYLAITLIVTIGYQLFFFSIAFSLKFDKLTGESQPSNSCQSYPDVCPTSLDFAGGTNFVVLAIITLAFSGYAHARQIVVSLFIIAWGARLSAFLLFRIIKTGKDDRFDDKRDNFFKFLGFWIFQMVWVWTVSLPVTVLNSPNITRFPQPAFGTGGDIAGVILFALGFVMESLSDIQKYRFKVSHRADKGAVCDRGLFSWSRHPNYFGEILIQFGESWPGCPLSISRLMLNRSYLHDRCLASSQRLRAWFPLQRTVRDDCRCPVAHYSSVLHLRSESSGTAWRQEALGEEGSLA